MITNPPTIPPIVVAHEGISTPRLPRCVKYGPNPKGCTTLFAERGSGRWMPSIYNALA